MHVTSSHHVNPSLHVSHMWYGLPGFLADLEILLGMRPCPRGQFCGWLHVHPVDCVDDGTGGAATEGCAPHSSNRNLYASQFFPPFRHEWYGFPALGPRFVIPCSTGPCTGHVIKWGGQWHGTVGVEDAVENE